MSEKKEVILIDLKVEGDDSIDKAVNSIGNLEKANKALREERKKLNLDTEEGKKRVSEINETINKNTDVIKANSDTLKKNQLNVGNYTESINKSKVANQNALAEVDKMSGGLIGQAKAIKTTYLAMGPLGLIIGAIGLAVGALTAYFKGSEEGQNRWNRIVAIGSSIVEKFTDIIEDVGKFLFESGKKASGFGKAFEAAMMPVTLTLKALKLLFPETAKAIGDFFDDAISRGANLAKMEAQYEIENRERTEARAKRDLEVSLLRRKADESEGKDKLKFLNEALALEAKSIEDEVKTATLRRDIAKEKLRINGDDKEALDDLSKAEAELYNAQRGAFDETRKMNRERLSTEEALRKSADDLMKKRHEAVMKEEDDRIKEEQKIIDLQAKRDKASEIELSGVIARIEKKEQLEDEQFQKTLEDYDKEGKAELEAAEKSYQLAVSIAARKKDIRDKEIEQTKANIDIAAGLAQGLTTTILAQYALEENALKVKLANELTAINSTFSTEKASLDAQLAAKTISQAQYDAGILAANQKLQADTKEAQVKQAIELNAIKKKQFEADKKNQIVQALADMAQAVLSVFAQAKGGPVIKGIAAAAAGAFSLIRVNQIRKTEFVPTTFDRGGKVGTFSGPSHARGGIDFVGSNGQRINVEGGENFYVLKKTASDQINKLSALNESHGGRPFYMGRQPASRLADGGLAASGGGISVRDFNNLVNKINSIQIVMPVEELDIVQQRRAVVAEKATIS